VGENISLLYRLLNKYYLTLVLLLKGFYPFSAS